jgi:hypothetical protein
VTMQSLRAASVEHGCIRLWLQLRVVRLVLVLVVVAGLSMTVVAGLSMTLLAETLRPDSLEAGQSRASGQEDPLQMSGYDPTADVYFGTAFSSAGAADRAAEMLVAAGYTIERQPGNVVVAFSDSVSDPTSVARASDEVRKIAALAGGEYVGHGGLTQVSP